MRFESDDASFPTEEQWAIFWKVIAVLMCILVVLAARRSWVDRECRLTCEAQGAAKYELFNLKQAIWSADCRCLDAHGRLQHSCPAAPASSPQ